ncbi:lysosome-associated membrane glycoprotein 1 [Stigmatopora argus]
MKSAIFILFCCLFSGLSLSKHVKPPATMAPAGEFFSSSQTVMTTEPTTPTTVIPTSEPTTLTTTGETTTLTSPVSETSHAPSTINATTPHAETTINATTAPTPHAETTATGTPPQPQPTPPGPVTAGDYRLLKNDTTVCVMAHVALAIRLETPKASGAFKVQPNKTHAVGECRQSRSNLTLVFPEGFITFLFNKSTEDSIGYVDTLTFRLNYPLSPASSRFSASNNSLRVLSAKLGHSYSCRSDSFYMGNGLYLDVKDDRVQAFNFSKSNEFGVTDQCAADQPNYSVAIGVGVTLLVLILVVVVVYLLGRRRRADGYQAL